MYIRKCIHMYKCMYICIIQAYAQTQVQEAMEAAFAKTHTQLLEQQNFDTFLSGSTAITVLVGKY